MALFRISAHSQRLLTEFRMMEAFHGGIKRITVAVKNRADHKTTLKRMFDKVIIERTFEIYKRKFVESIFFSVDFLKLKTYSIKY